MTDFLFLCRRKKKRTRYFCRRFFVFLNIDLTLFRNQKKNVHTSLNNIPKHIAALCYVSTTTITNNKTPTTTTLFMDEYIFVSVFLSFSGRRLFSLTFKIHLYKNGTHGVTHRNLSFTTARVIITI